MSEYIQFTIPYSVNQNETLQFYIYFTTLVYHFIIETSTNGIQWTPSYTFENFFNSDYFISSSFEIPENTTKFFRVIFLDSFENNSKIKEFSVYRILNDGSFKRIIPLFTNESLNLIDPVIPSSLIGNFTVSSSENSYGPANLFDLTKETVYTSDISFTVNGEYIGNDRISVRNSTYHGTFIDVSFPYSINFDSYSLISSNNIHKFPKKWVVLGSSDGVTYSNVIDTITLDTLVYPYTCYSFEIGEPVSYKSIRIVIENTFAAVQCEFSEFSVSSLFSGGRIIPASIQPISQDPTVTFGVKQGNAREVYSGISVNEPEWIRVTFPYYPGTVSRIVIYGDHLPSDLDIYNVTNNSIIGSISRNLSVSESLTIQKIDNSQSTSDFKFVFKRLQPNTDGYSRIRITQIIFYDSFGNRMNFLWDPLVNYFTYNDQNQVNVLSENTIEGGQYIGSSRSYINIADVYIYGEYRQLSYSSPVQTSGFYINTNGLGWEILGSNDAQNWDIVYSMNPFNEVPSRITTDFKSLDEYSIQFGDSIVIRCSEPNLDLQNLLLLDSYQHLNSDSAVPSIDAQQFYWYNGVDPIYGFTGRDSQHYTYIKGLDPTTYDPFLLSEYIPFDEENDPTPYVPKAVDGVYGVYFDFKFPKKVRWNGLRLFVRRIGTIPVFTPRWVFFFGSNDGQNWTMFTEPQYYDFSEFYNTAFTSQEYTYIFDFYNDYYSYFRFQIASCGTGYFDIGSMQWIGNSDPHEIFKTVDVPSTYSNYRGVITNSNSSTTAVFTDFAMLNSYGERIDGLYSGGEYHGTNSYQGIRGEYISVQGSCKLVSSSSTFKKISVVSENGTVTVLEDDRLSGTYLCESPLIFNIPPTLPPDYELVLYCPRPVQLGSFSFKTDNLVINYNASIPVTFSIMGANSDNSFEVIQEYNEQLQYDTEYTFTFSAKKYTRYKFSVTSYNKIDATFMSIYKFQMYSPLGFPVISDDGNVIPNITDIPANGPSVLVFENVESLDGNLNIDEIILT